MKQFFTLFFIFSIFCIGYAQDYNLSLLGTLNFNTDGSDIWGYVDDQGTEYALMGTVDGTHVISLADPTNPTEVLFIDGGNSMWRDLKTFGNYAYITTEAPDGILIIDLSDIANGNTNHVFYQPEFQDIVWGKLLTIHNLYIDENGFCYIAGSNLNDGGVLIFDLNQDPMSPPLVGKCENIYSHDVYVRNNICWSSNINDGHFSAIDVTDKTNPVTLAYQETTFDYSHNAWLSDNGQFLFTTDERPNANIDAYDVSDLDNIQLIDTWIPPTTVGEGVIPHNVHVYNDYLVISYYTDGIKIVDAHRPSNLVEVGSYDTHTQFSNDFHGCWGAYPFLPSELVLASDIEAGLFVFEPTYQRACYLEGTITDSDSGLPINNALITLDSGTEDNTPSNGEYATGQVTPGVFQATYSKVGYFPQTIEVTLENGQITIQDVALIPEPPLQLTGQVINEGTSNSIPEAVVRIVGPGINISTITDSEGNFEVGPLFTDEYIVYAGKWGYSTNLAEVSLAVGAENNAVVEITEGYEDPFAVDLGWETETTASAGGWEIGEPIGTTYNNAPFNPDFDVDSDIGDWCYVTGNEGGSAANDDVDGGSTLLLSPSFDLTDYNDPHISFYAWFMNGGGSGNPNDELTITLLNGDDQSVIEVIEDNTSDWVARDIRILDYISLTDSMKFMLRTSDFSGSGHLVEAGLDQFIVYDDETSPVENLEEIALGISPNPFHSQLSIQLPEELSSGRLNIYDTLGKLIYQQAVNQQTFVSLDTEKWSNGFYQIVYTSNETSISHKVIKQ